MADKRVLEVRTLPAAQEKVLQYFQAHKGAEGVKIVKVTGMGKSVIEIEVEYDEWAKVMHNFVMHEQQAGAKKDDIITIIPK